MVLLLTLRVPPRAGAWRVPTGSALLESTSRVPARPQIGAQTGTRASRARTRCAAQGHIRSESAQVPASARTDTHAWHVPIALAALARTGQALALAETTGTHAERASMPRARQALTKQAHAPALTTFSCASFAQRVEMERTAQAALGAKLAPAAAVGLARQVSTAMVAWTTRLVSALPASKANSRQVVCAYKPAMHIGWHARMGPPPSPHLAHTTIP